MFNGELPDHHHHHHQQQRHQHHQHHQQFLVTRTPHSLPRPSFHAYPNLLLQQHHHSPFPPQPTSFTAGDDNRPNPSSFVLPNLVRDDARVPPVEPAHDWSNDEVLALLRLRSGVDIWFSDFVWEQVSRKMEELGYSRSAERCKEKYEEESRQLNTICCNSKNYRLFGELEEVCHGESLSCGLEKKRGEEDGMEVGSQVNGREDTVVAVDSEKSKCKKKKRKKRFEMLRGFCEKMVRTMIVQQEEWYSKLIQDLMRKDEEKFAREEAWKQQKMERMEKEIEIRADEQAAAGDRQVIIMEFLKKVTGGYPRNTTSSSLSSSPSTTRSSANPNPTFEEESNPENVDFPPPVPPTPGNPNPSGLEDVGKRWPRDEVLALINLRCNLHNNGEDRESIKGPLWERISQGMLQLGYRRSAKRCKEKWENINKYFRKTRDVNKNRSLNSRTCPYFHQLNAIYRHGTTLKTSAIHSSPVLEADATDKPSLPAFDFQYSD